MPPSEQFRDRRQEDPSEFLERLLDCLEMEAEDACCEVEEEDVHPKPWYILGLIIESIRVQTAPYYQCVRCGLASDDHDIQVPAPDHRILVHLTGKKQQDLQPMVNRLQAPEEIEQFKCTAKCTGNIELRHKRRAREASTKD